jgi:hypothetical protein
VVPLSLIIVFTMLKIAFLFWNMIAAFGTPGSDPVAVVLYSQIGMMCTFVVFVVYMSRSSVVDGRTTSHMLWSNR